jgi:hypothetical protein
MKTPAISPLNPQHNTSGEGILCCAPAMTCGLVLTMFVGGPLGHAPLWPPETIEASAPGRAPPEGMAWRPAAKGRPSF